MTHQLNCGDIMPEPKLSGRSALPWICFFGVVSVLLTVVVVCISLAYEKLQDENWQCKARLEIVEKEANSRYSANERLRDELRVAREERDEYKASFGGFVAPLEPIKEAGPRVSRLLHKYFDRIEALEIELAECRECRDQYRDALTQCELDKSVPILPHPDVPPPRPIQVPELTPEPLPEILPDIKPSPPDLCTCGCGRLKSECRCCKKHDHKKPEKKHTAEKKIK